MLRIEVETGSDWANRLRAPWDELWRSMEFCTPFHSLAWLESCATTIGRNQRPRVLTFWDGGDLAAALPLVERRTPFRILRSMASGPSDYLHPLVLPGYKQKFAVAMAEYVVSNSDVTIDLHQIRETYDHCFEQDGWQRRSQAQCLSLDLPGSFEEYLSTLGKSLRYEAKRLQSKALKGQGVRIVEANASNVGYCLDIFFELHSARWRKRGLPGAFWGRLKELHRLWAPLAIEQDLLWLRILENQSGPVGAIYAMKAGETCFFYQAGMDPNAKSISPGTILVAETIRRSIEEGLTIFDFMRGDESYKRRWMPQHAYTNLRAIRPAKGVSGTIVMRNLSLRAEIEDRLRSRLEKSAPITSSEPASSPTDSN